MDGILTLFPIELRSRADKIKSVNIYQVVYIIKPLLNLIVSVELVERKGAQYEFTKSIRSGRGSKGICNVER